MESSTTAWRASARSGLLLVMSAAVLWGTVGVTTKSLYGLSAAPPLSVGFFRLALAVPILWAAGWVTLKRQIFHVAARDLGLMALIGAMLAMYQVLFFTAVASLGVAVATLITLCSAPVMVAALSALFFKETLTRRVLVALACALTGTALMVQVAPAGLRNSAGVGWALGAALGYAVMALASRDLAGRYHPIQSIAISFSIGALVLLLVATGSAGLVLSYPPVGWGLLIYLGAVPTALGYGLFFQGMRHTPAVVASIATLLEPLTSTVLAWLIFRESLGVVGLAGAALLCAGLVVLWRR